MRFCLLAFTVCIILGGSTLKHADAQTNVVAFWHFEDYDFRDELDLIPDGEAGSFSVAADSGDLAGNQTLAFLQAHLGDASELDGNGGGGFLSYTSPVSGASYGTSRTIKFDDLRGGGDDFGLGSEPLFDQFNIDRNDGAGAQLDDFSNDALLYLNLDGSNYQDFEIRFDVEGTPTQEDTDDFGNSITVSSLPDGFDIFYRTTGPGGTFFRDPGFNNVPLTFADLDPLNPDPDNQVASTGFLSLNAALDNSSQIELIISDFTQGNGNNELELDNFEIVANVSAIPEPASATLFLMAGLGLAGIRRRN